MDLQLSYAALRFLAPRQSSYIMVYYVDNSLNSVCLLGYLSLIPGPECIVCSVLNILWTLFDLGQKSVNHNLWLEYIQKIWCSQFNIESRSSIQQLKFKTLYLPSFCINAAFCQITPSMFHATPFFLKYKF